MKFQRHKNMEYIAIAKNIKITPRKMRLVVDGVKKQNIKAALASLAVMLKVGVVSELLVYFGEIVKDEIVG